MCSAHLSNGNPAASGLCAPIDTASVWLCLGLNSGRFLPFPGPEIPIGRNGTGGMRVKSGHLVLSFIADSLYGADPTLTKPL